MENDLLAMLVIFIILGVAVCCMFGICIIFYIRGDLFEEGQQISPRTKLRTLSRLNEDVEYLLSSKT